MPVSTTLNKKPAATNRDGLYLVLATTRLNSGKDNRYGLVHDHGARVQHNAAFPISDPLAS